MLFHDFWSCLWTDFLTIWETTNDIQFWDVVKYWLILIWSILIVFFVIFLFKRVGLYFILFYLHNSTRVICLLWEEFVCFVGILLEMKKSEFEQKCTEGHACNIMLATSWFVLLTSFLAVKLIQCLLVNCSNDKRIIKFNNNHNNKQIKNKNKKWHTNSIQLTYK